MSVHLQIVKFPVTGATFDGAARLEETRPLIRREEVQRLPLEDPCLQKLEIGVARPGERARILHLPDTLEPRWNAEGPSATFPGVSG